MEEYITVSFPTHVTEIVDILTDFLLIRTPVSYTHLDVYKRQFFVVIESSAGWYYFAESKPRHAIGNPLPVLVHLSLIHI